MANMPAFEAACAMARHASLQGRVGLHFNLTYGRPLSASILRSRTFCDGHGVFDLSLPRHSLWLSREDRDAVREELQAQWQRCVEHGVRPSHIDSHQHVHNIWPIGEIVARFAAQQGVPIRLARNLGQNLSLPKRVFKGLLNWRLQSLAGATADYVCTPVDLQQRPRTERRRAGNRRPPQSARQRFRRCLSQPRRIPEPRAGAAADGGAAGVLCRFEQGFLRGAAALD
jgi:predicted glycoside hydrolase/deacetylase ChbG (UPF0249 family)